MMWGYSGTMWIWMVPMMLVIWLTVIGVIVLTIRLLSAPHSNVESTIETLRRRLASGQITPDEYEHTRRLLEG